jgi:arylsulfatase A-like enzyme
MGYAMRTDRYRYIEWRERRNGDIAGVELYDHTSDPNENLNVARRPENAALVKQLSEQLRGGWKTALPVAK